MFKKTSLPILLALFLFPASAQAAKLYFEPETAVVAPGEEFRVQVFLDTEDKFINAVGGEIISSGKITITRASDGNSIVNLWVERPSINTPSGSVSFDGITPGGFAGKDGLILTLTVKAREEISVSTVGSLSFGEGAQAFISDGQATPAPLVLGTSSITIDPNRQKPKAPEETDTVPPEDFTPDISRSPELFDNKYFLVFGTQDKGSGIDHYEVLEIRDPPLALKGDLPWVRAESPFVLKDQSLKSTIYVKALDYSGNQRIAAVPPRLISLMKTPLFYAIIILILVIPSWFIVRKLKKRL